MPDQVTAHISGDDVAIDSVVVVRNGYIVFEEYPAFLYNEDITEWELICTGHNRLKLFGAWQNGFTAQELWALLSTA